MTDAGRTEAPATRMTRDEVLAAIQRERTRLRELVDRLETDAERRTVTEEGWTAKDVLAHCIHWAGQLAFGMGAKMQPPPWVVSAGAERPPTDEWNRRAVEHYRDKPLATVVADFDRAADAVLQQVRARSDEQLNASGALPWATNEPLWKSIASETFAHWPDHSDDLERALQWST